MADEITKPVGDVVGHETEGAEPIGEVQEPVIEVPIPEAEKISEPIIVSEPAVVVSTEPISITVQEPVVVQPEPAQVPEPEVVTPTESTPTPPQTPRTDPVVSPNPPETFSESTSTYSSNPKLNSAAMSFINNMSKDRTKETLAMANQVLKAERERRMYRIMDMFKKKDKITRKDIVIFIHVHRDTVAKYIKVLLKEGKIKRVGKGPATKYTKI